MHPQHHKRVTPARPGQTGSTARTPAGGAVGAKGHKTASIAADAIRLCAYLKWERAGRPDGDGIQFWLEAEQELMRGK